MTPVRPQSEAHQIVSYLIYYSWEIYYSNSYNIKFLHLYVYSVLALFHTTLFYRSDVPKYKLHPLRNILKFMQFVFQKWKLHVHLEISFPYE